MKTESMKQLSIGKLNQKCAEGEMLCNKKLSMIAT